MAILHSQTRTLDLFDIRREPAASQRGGVVSIGFAERVAGCVSQILRVWGNRGRGLVNGRERSQSEKTSFLWSRPLIRFPSLVARWTLDRVCQVPLQYLYRRRDSRDPQF